MKINDDIIKYFNDAKDKIGELINNDDNLSKGKVKELFTTLIDFLFKDGEIKGVKLDDISNDTKIKLLDIFKNLDTYIVKVWPNYKDDLASKKDIIFDNIKDKAGDIFQGIKNKIGEDKVETFMDSTKDTHDDIKEFMSDAKDKLSSLYDKFKNN